jgi:hypothetical protein
MIGRQRFRENTKKMNCDDNDAKCFKSVENFVSINFLFFWEFLKNNVNRIFG